MNKIPYPKPLASFTDQITLLKQRGLTFLDEKKAIHLLQNISYYRMSGYWYPLLSDKKNHVFKPGSTFETDLLKRYPSIDVRAMGFPTNWEDETLWK